VSSDPEPGRRSAACGRFYSSPPGGPAARRATDVIVLLAALAALGLLVVAYPPGQFERAFASLLRAFPG
jgi:hypothetical protein